MPRHRPRGPEVVTAVVGACLGLYGLLTTLVASAWGPGNSDELVSGGLELIPWYGLSCGGTVAAVLGLWLIKRPRLARWALLVAAVSLASWTVFAYTRGDTSAIASPVMSEPFVINVADARALHFDGSGTYVPFEDPTDRFPDFGINIHMPGGNRARPRGGGKRPLLDPDGGRAEARRQDPLPGEREGGGAWRLGDRADGSRSKGLRRAGRASSRRRSCPGHRPDQAASPSSRSYARIHLRMALSETPYRRPVPL